MEEKLSEVLDNLLGLLLLEGSYEIEDNKEGVSVSIETKDAGRLIGFRGESLEVLQLLINQIMSRKQQESAEGFKRVILDVGGWRKNKEKELSQKAQEWGKGVLESSQILELESQPAWQRRIVHMVISQMEGLETESVGEGRDRHVVISRRDTGSEISRATIKLKSQKPVPSEAEG